MQSLQFLKRYYQQAVFAIGILVPFLAILIYPKYYQPDDLDAFLRWSQYWSMDWKNIYNLCQSCNYPILGMMFSSGVPSWLGINTMEGMIGVFRYYLAVVDLINVVLIYLILRKMRVDGALFWAGVIAILPSSWMGTSYWGQIDSFGQLFILSIILWTAWFNFGQKRDLAIFYTFVIVYGLLLSCLTLTKQLALFSLAPLGMMIMLNILLQPLKWKERPMLFFILFVAYAAPFFIAELFLKTPLGYVSHFQYVLATGSNHGDVVSSYGFNVWRFFVSDPLTSSHDSVVVPLGQSFQLSVIPYRAGILIFILVNVFLVSLTLFYFRKRFARLDSYLKEDFSFWMMYLGLVNLSFNLFLSGTHERYLYHFYPFVMVALLSLPKHNMRSLILASSGAFFYGCFLFGYLTGWNQLFGDLMFDGMGIFHLIFFIYLGSLLWQHVRMGGLEMQSEAMVVV